jgi:hypothetical protein
LQPLLLAVVVTCRQRRTGALLLTLCVGLLQALGRHTLTQVLAGLGRGECDWSAAYRLFSQARFDLAAGRQALLARLLALIPADRPLVVVLDGTQLARTSRRFVGTGWLQAPRTPVWRPGIHWAQRWVGLSVLLPRSDQGESRTVPLRFAPAPTPTATPWPDQPPCKEWEAGRDALAQLRTELEAADRPDQLVLAVADGSYGGAPLRNALPPDIVLLTRCAKNRALYALPPPPQPGQRGRRRLYGERLPTPQRYWQERAGWQAVDVVVRGRTIPLRVRVVGPWLIKRAPTRPVFLLAVRGILQKRRGRLRRRDPAYWLVTAIQDEAGAWVLPYPVAELLSWAWQRWEVEVLHRELKSGFGLGEQQAWSPVVAVLVIQWVVGVYACLVLAGFLSWGWEQAGSGPRWWRGRRWTARTVAAQVRRELWDLEAVTFAPSWVWIPPNPAEMRSPPLPVTTPALAARRL